MKTIANYISIARIFFSITLLVAKPLSIVFFAIYLVCGISDVFDGYIARKTDTASKLGEKLDSVADLIMVVILTIVLYPIINSIINSIINPTVQIIVWVVIIGIVRVVSMIVVFVKYKTFGILHTYGNKITGLVLFAFPLSLAFSQSDVLMYIICMVASAAAFEELFIHLLSNELQANKKSIFLK
ncbi:CDP-alcohol phosphatidyltransferase family protein [Clostridium sp. CF011]|uniref:CDP-alcohol phosphatidyltransferase family protein n=1 Tax=unclassified Clostridium TaxID=2614128 RepID=UPI001C0C1C30|nr:MULTISPECIES: CDP-alcohol phosphatidyltransferase family protein [unclassified Clostridium]MBU3093304.1 CDP-alcohol phosphatidyltransferase family protein [Clostridium sp. CF011]MBW9146714.1 CDP-alcohol phosphatidyltransferase family protein [Clostridium sp. CM027]UVE41627.1 CDP-alcohol phosphatidyltransferase family protein [Clostridium sp. CM027]WAG70620.1 CDP-alcohol phosphatidyltransferase family protein [Clostridium sp. CF011]